MSIGIIAFRVISISFPFAGASIVLSSAFQGVNKASYSMFLSIIRQLVVLIPASFILGKLFGLSFLWLGFFISEVVAFIISLLMVKSIYSKQLSKWENK